MGMGSGCAPDFLIVGAAKSGTTVLWQWLRQHADVFMPDVKEPHYFCFAGKPVPHVGAELDPFYLSTLVTSTDAYDQLWQKSKPGQLRGEASPGYLYHSGTAARISARNPQCRIIAVLRNPARRAFSQYMHHARDGYEPLHSFEEALAAEQSRIASGWWWGYHYLAAGAYAAQWQRYCEAFPPEQRLLLLHEDVESDPATCYAAICRFLGITPLQQDFSIRVNETAGLKTVPNAGAFHAVLRHGSALTHMARDILPARVGSAIRHQLQKWNSHAAPKLCDATLQRLQEHYQPDIGALARLTGQDFSRWQAD